MAGDLVWTTHLEERLKLRGISRNEAWETVRHPQSSHKQGGNKWKLFRTFAGKQVVLVAVYEQGQWIILTGWTKPVVWQPGGRKLAAITTEHWLSRISRRFLFDWLGGLVRDRRGK